LNKPFDAEYTLAGKTYRWSGSTWDVVSDAGRLGSAGITSPTGTDRAERSAGKKLRGHKAEASGVFDSTEAKAPWVASVSPKASIFDLALKLKALVLDSIRQFVSRMTRLIRSIPSPAPLVQKLTLRVSQLLSVLFKGLAKSWGVVRELFSRIFAQLSAFPSPAVLLKKLFAWVRVVLIGVAKFFARLQNASSQLMRKLLASAKPSTVNKKEVALESTMPLLAPAVAPTFTEELAPQVRSIPVAPAVAPPLNQANQEPASQARPRVLTLAKYLAVIQTLTHRFVSQFLAFAKSSSPIQKLVSRVKKQFSPRDNGPVIRNGETVRTLKAKSTRIDKIFRAIATSSGGLTVGVMLAVGLFLGFRALTAIDVAGLSFLTEQSWSPETQTFGVAAVLFGTVTIALIALSISVPLSIGTALLISMVVSERTRRFLISLVDLMAAVPSVIFGLWGGFFLQANIIPVSRWISDTFGWIPIFSVTNDAGEKLIDASAFTSSAFIAGIVVSLMVVPTQTSIMREAFMQTPIGEREGALALGATRWSMITTVVLPFGKGGMIGGTMLGLGRALGETIAVYMIISPVFVINWQLLKTGTNSVSSLIALRYGEASEFGISALMAAGLVLFLITLVINFAASTIVARSRSGAEG